MPRLPSQLQPAWPLFKRAHRLGTRSVGSVTRRLPVPEASRAVPRRATSSADDTARLEPDAVRLHTLGDAEDLERPMPVGTPQDHWVFEHWRHFVAPRRFVLEIQDGLVVGDYSAHITPGGTLDYESSTYFGVTGWREHPIYLRPRLPEQTRVDGTLVSLATRGSAANYYHFLLDVLPRWGLFQEAFPGREPDAVYVNRATRYQQQLLAMIGVDRVPAVEPSTTSAVRADRLVVPCIPNPELMAPRWTTQWLQERLPVRESRGLPRRLYLTRGEAKNTRRLANEAVVLPALERRGFVRIDPGTLTVQEQIDHFAAAEAIVAPHGAALGNLVFCRPGTRVLELFAPRYVNPCYWAIAANIPDGRYRYLVCGQDRRGTGAPMTGVLQDITVDPAQLDAAVDDLLLDG